MGTHPSMPSKDVDTQRSLLNLVSEHETLMGKAVSQKYKNNLPFLVKVLSISKALSIQAHPNKKLAEQLHSKDPKNYPDDNHKPEMTIAITPFEGLCGFRPLNEIAHFLGTIPPLRALVGEAQSKSLESTAAAADSDQVTSKSSLRAAFTALLKSDRDEVRKQSKSLVALAESQSIAPGPSVNTPTELCELVTRCHAQFPHDIGLFVLFFLNYVKLSPGQAMYLKADDIHAYLSGDIVECMASSDNVIRAGFTPKFQDVDTLTDILTYDHNPPEAQLLEPRDYPYMTFNTSAYGSASSALLYDPPIPEFSVVRTELKALSNAPAASTPKATFEGIAGPSIVICTAGSGSITVGSKMEDLKEGCVFFVGAAAECVIRSDGKQDMVTFRAFCEIDDEREGKKTNGH
jgi:mannose-6-phosphate isomerase